MLKNPHLLYRIKRHLQGFESGIVERIDEVGLSYNGKTCFFLDDESNPPTKITFVTPLKERVTRHVPFETKIISGFGLVPDKVGRVYKEYEVGQKYP